MSSNRMQLWMGGMLVAGGALLLAGSLFNFDAWAFCWPLGLVALGVWLVTRPASSPLGGPINYRFLGEIRRGGNWRVLDEEFNQFVGDIRLDLTQAQIALGETRLRFAGFVGDITLIVPAGVGVSVTSAAFVTDLDFLGQHRATIFAPINTATPGYAAAERRLRLEVNYFVLDLNIHPGERV